MHSLTLAKRRWSRRRHEAGAALFVVSMTISVLASVGIYALAAASNDVKTSGYERQNTQTHYLSMYGVLGTAHEITSTKAKFYLNLMQDPRYRDKCPGSLGSVPTAHPTLGNLTLMPDVMDCRRLPAGELSAVGTPWAVPYVDAYAGTAPYQAGVTPGSFGPTTIQGDFFVELTEPVQANPPARYGLNLNFCFIEMTVSSSGTTRPTFPSNPNWTQTFGSEGIEVQRARILAGPIQCPGK